MRTAVLQPVLTGQRGRSRAPDGQLREAEGLCRAIDLEIAHVETCLFSVATPATLFGSGKVSELKDLFAEQSVALVVVNGVLTPVQQRNLERAWGCKVIDRTGLILEIFGERAHTREGVLQVELAHLNYQKGRLVRSWTHLERQRGGVGFLGGPGETQIEADRRALDEKIARIRQRLDKVVRTRALHRAARQRAPRPVVALVGYTNAGKSTLFNRLTQADVLAKDMLFATLDPSMRAIQTPRGRPLVLSDTVGFVSDLPTQLVAAFRATLEEVVSADLIVHVRDVTDPETEAQRNDVLSVLRALGLAEEELGSLLEARNKIDALPPEERQAVENEALRDANAVCVSATTGDGVDALLREIEERLTASDRDYELLLPSTAGAEIAWLHGRGCVLSRTDDERGVTLRLRMGDADRGQFEKRFGPIDEEVLKAVAE